ncbi:MAG: magnesium transporter [Azospirillum brasilense]|nr:MAG: magnesium transporter [Azospirillum brasilense]
MSEATIASEFAPLDPDTGFSLSPEFVAEVVEAIAREDRTTARALVYPLPAPDQAELFDQITPDERHFLTEILAEGFDAETLAEMSPEAAEDVLEALGAEKSAEVLAEMETDDAVHILEDLAPEAQQEILDEMPADIRDEVVESLTYPLESAGRLMRNTLVAVPESWSVGDTIDYLRATDELPEHFYVLYAVDGQFHPTGRILLGNILSHKREVKLSAIMNGSTFAVHTHTDQEEVAYLFRKYALVEAPVVNDTGALVGTITVDDVVDVIQEEEEEDYLRAGGVSTPDFGSRIFDAVKARFGWLFLNLWTAALAAFVISRFEDSIEKIVALAVLMPVVASMGGNTGTQAVTVAVRAIATKHLTDANRWSYVRKEMLIGFLNGCALGVLMAVGSYLWFRELPFAGVMLAAATITMTTAGLFGALIPILLDKRGIDPAIASSIFLTTVTDCLGFFSFLGLATLILL